MQKHAFGKKALTLLLTLCMVFTTIAPAASSVVYADSVSDHTGSSSVSSVDPGNASSVATGGEEQNSGSSSTPTQSQPDSTSNSTSVPAADGGGSDSTSAPPANSSSVPTDNGEETSSSSTSEIPEDSSAPENEDGTGEDESEEDKESEGDNSAEEFIPLAIIDPETGDVIEAEVGDEVTLSSLLNRDDILVSYQWQRMQQPTKRVAANIKPIYDYRLNMYTERDVAVAGIPKTYLIALRLEGFSFSPNSIIWKGSTYVYKKMPPVRYRVRVPGKEHYVLPGLRPNAQKGIRWNVLGKAETQASCQKGSARSKKTCYAKA